MIFHGHPLQPNLLKAGEIVIRQAKLNWQAEATKKQCLLSCMPDTVFFKRN